MRMRECWSRLWISSAEAPPSSASWPADIAVALVLWDGVQQSPGPMRKRDEVADTGLLASDVELVSLGSVHGSAFVIELNDTIFVLNSLCS